MRKLVYLKYFIAEASKNLWYSRGINGVSIVTIAVSLYIMGIFLLLVANLSLFFSTLSEKMQIEIFLEEEISESQKDEIAFLLNEDPLVKDFFFISKSMALQRFRENFPDLKQLPGAMERNPVPSSFEVILEEGPHTDEMIAFFVERYTIQGGVEDIGFDREWIMKLNSYFNLMKGGGIFLGGILFLTAAFTISNVIRLNLYSRREEIEIMRLVGATNNFIRGPFLMEGFIQGLIGSFISILVLFITYWLFVSYSEQSFNILLSFFTSTFISGAHMALIIAAGALIGLTGSFLSLRKFLII
jgi:cell division transport system permease protein